MRALKWLSDLAEQFDAALDWQEVDDLLLEAPTQNAPAGRPRPSTDLAAL